QLADVQRLREAAAARKKRIFWGSIAAGAAILGVTLFEVYWWYSTQLEKLEMQQRTTVAELEARQKADIAAQNFRLAVAAAQDLLNQIGEAQNHGDITVKGARDLLDTISKILDRVQDVERTPETAELGIKLALTAADITFALSDYKGTYTIAQR